MTDIDGLEYAYNQNGIDFVAVIDYKAVLDDTKNLKQIKLGRSSIQANKKLASRLNVPFFIVVTYLTDNYKVPMYYVYPANILAADKLYNFNRCKKSWMSIYDFALFQHFLRNIEPEFEIDNLSKEMNVYKLPEIV